MRMFFENKDWLIIDELSLVSSSLVDACIGRAHQVKGGLGEFGGFCTFSVGDFLQIQPVKQECLYKTQLDESQIGRPVGQWLEANRVFQLLQNHRIQSSTFSFLQQLLSRISQPEKYPRPFETSMFASSCEHCAKNPKLCAHLKVPTVEDIKAYPEWNRLLILTMTNQTVEELNPYFLQRFARLEQPEHPVLRYPLEGADSRARDLLEGFPEEDRPPGAFGYFVQGAFVQLVDNNNVKAGLVKNACGTLRDILFEQMPAEISRKIAAFYAQDRAEYNEVGYIDVPFPLFIEIDLFATIAKPASRVFVACSSKEQLTSDRLFVLQITKQLRISLFRSGYRLHFASTPHNAEGLTIHNRAILLDTSMKLMPWDIPCLNVALSRGTNPDLLRLAPFSKSSNEDISKICKLTVDEKYLCWKQAFNSEGFFVRAKVAEYRALQVLKSTSNFQQRPDPSDSDSDLTPEEEKIPARTKTELLQHRHRQDPEDEDTIKKDIASGAGTIVAGSRFDIRIANLLTKITAVIEKRASPAADVAPPRKIGFENPGVMCYFNATLTLLFNTRPFTTQYLNQFQGPYLFRIYALTHMECDFFDLFIAYFQCPGLFIKAVTPVCTAIRQHLLNANFTGQEDVSEVLTHLLVTFVPKAVLNLCFSLKWKISSKCENCKRVSSRMMIDEICLWVGLPTAMARTMSSLINDFCNSPDLIQGYNCPFQCAGEASSSYELLNNPDFFLIGVKRTQFNVIAQQGTRNAMPISSTLGILFQGQRYQCIGVLNHIGTAATNGHYISTIYDEKKRIWLQYNDKIVHVVDNFRVEQNILPFGYVYLYAKILF